MGVVFNLAFTLLATILVWLGYQLLAKVTDWGGYATWFVVINIVTFFMYGLDKGLAELFGNESSWVIRVPRLVLHLLALGGGILGGIFGMLLFRHKSSYTKPKNRWFLPILAFSALIHFPLLYFMTVPLE